MHCDFLLRDPFSEPVLGMLNEPTPLAEILKDVFRQMNPEACLQRGLHAIATGDLTEACLALSDYRAWRARGGYEPPPDGDTRANELERLLLLRRKTPTTT